MELPRKVTIKWLARKDKQGRRYLVLRPTWPDGTRTDRGIGFRTPEEADREAARMLLGEVVGSANSAIGTVADVLAHYVADVESRKPDSKFATNEDLHAKNLGRHLGRRRVESVTTSVLRWYIGARRQEPTKRGTPPSRASLFEEVRCYLAALKLSIDEGRIACRVPVRPRRKDFEDDARPPRMLAPSEVAALTAAAYGWPGRADGELLGGLVSLLAWQGRRPVATWGLRYSDCAQIRTEGRLFWVQDKAGIGRGWGPVSRGARDAVVRLLEARPGVGARLLFTGAWDQPLTTEHFGKYWMPALCEAAQIPAATAYDLRRHACTQLANASGGNLKKCLPYTGHTKVETFLRYVYARDEDARAMGDRIGPAVPAIDEQVDDG